MKVTTIPGLLLLPIAFFSVFMLPKKYPHAYSARFIRTPHSLNCILTVAAIVLSVVLGYYVLFEMAPHNWIMMICYYIFAIGYTIIRRNYVKKNDGYDIFEKMKETYQPWEEMEEQAKASANK